MLISASFGHSWGEFPSTVVYVEVKRPDGKIDIGSAFHLGRGFFATARHVIEGNTLLAIGRDDTSKRTHIQAAGGANHSSTYPDFKCGGPFAEFYHEDASVDVAVIQARCQIAGYGDATNLQPSVQLARDVDLLTQGEFLMTEVVVAGFPPISQTLSPYLVVIGGNISAVIENRHDKKRHFVVSGMARGGFSGGPVFLVSNPTVETSASRIEPNGGKIVGLVGHSLIDGAATHPPPAEQLGFLAAISVETVREVIKTNGLPLTDL